MRLLAIEQVADDRGRNDHPDSSDTSLGHAIADLKVSGDNANRNADNITGIIKNTAPRLPGDDHHVYGHDDRPRVQSLDSANDGAGGPHEFEDARIAERPDVLSREVWRAAQRRW